MSYSGFLEYIGSAFPLLINTLTGWISTLMSNYFFITILGVVIFSSFVLFFIDFIFEANLFSKKHDDKNNQFN